MLTRCEFVAGLVYSRLDSGEGFDGWDLDYYYERYLKSPADFEFVVEWVKNLNERNC